MTILCLPRPRDCASRFLNTWAAARPSFSAVSAVTGSTLAVPRTPSVPKIFLCGFIRLLVGRAGTHQDLFRDNLFQSHISGNDNFDAEKLVKVRQVRRTNISLNTFRA